MQCKISSAKISKIRTYQYLIRLLYHTPKFLQFVQDLPYVRVKHRMPGSTVDALNLLRFQVYPENGQPFGIPSLKHKHEMPDCFHFNENNYGVPNPLQSGWNSARSQLASNHPLESAIRNFRNDQIRVNNSVMLLAQGPAAPLIQAMELRAVKQVGRHPFLPSSNFQLEVLTGRDMEMDFDDFLNTEEFKEVQAQPHVVMENFPLKPLF